MGRITPSFRQLYKDAWSREQAAMGNSTLPTVCDKLNLIASIHNRKLTATLAKELKDKDMKIKQLSDRIIELENTVRIIMDKLKADTAELK